MSRSADPAELVPGRIVASKYRLEQPIGRGGMGVVFRALHLELSFNVAIKVLTTDVDSADARERFLREARAAAQIRSEHAARVFDLGSLPSGAPFIVMECLEGVNLRQYLRQRGKATPEQAVSFIVQACRAVAEAHALGIVHRDIKPSNLFLCERDNAPPVVKVLDFGISKTLGAIPASATMTGVALVGSPQYMSPERLRAAAKIDATVDVWAFGAVLYELISGEPAFSGETVPALLASIVADTPVPLSTRCPQVPPHVVQAVEKCLQKDPTKRYANALELLQALAAQPLANVNLQPTQAVVEPASSDNTKVQPGFSDTTLMLSPSDIELLSEPQPPTTTTIEPITKDATGKTKARTTTPRANVVARRWRPVAFALGAAGVVAGTLLMLRWHETSGHSSDVAQQTDALRPASGTSDKSEPTVVPLPSAPPVSITPIDQRPMTPDDLFPVLPNSEDPLEAKIALGSKTRLAAKTARGSKATPEATADQEFALKPSPKAHRRKDVKGPEEVPEARPPSAARKPKKSSGAELFSDIH